MEYATNFRRNSHFLFALFIIIGSNISTASEKIIMLPASTAGHVRRMDAIAEALDARGYSTYIIVNSRSEPRTKILENKNVKVIEYDTRTEPIFQQRKFVDMLQTPEVTDAGFFIRLKTFVWMLKAVANECREVMINVELVGRLKEEKFKFIVLDSMMKCFFLLAHELNVPFAAVTTFLAPDMPPVALQSPFLLSIPRDDVIFPDAPHMLATIGKMLIWLVLSRAGQFGDISNFTSYDAQKQTKLWLCDRSTILNDPIVLSPNVINVGYLGVRKPRPLTENEIKEFVDSASDGFIYVSFGTIAKYLPDRIIQVLLDTFSELPYKVVWRWDKKSLKADQVVPPNVLCVNKIRAIDILGHRNVKLFVTHCGNGGIQSAMYNAVPMVGIPLFADQLFNCKRIEGRFGRHIRLRDLSKIKLVAFIKDVINDRRYSDNIGKALEIFRDQPMEPRQTAAFWIDHVIKYGADHLQGKTNEMSWIEILMLDVLFAFFVVAFVTTSIPIFFLCRCAHRRCRRKRQDKAKQS